MKFMYSFILLLSVLSTADLKAQHLDSLLSKIIFDVELTNPDSTIISKLQAKKGLKLVESENEWLLFPPVSSHPLRGHTFKFQKNDFFNFNFSKTKNNL